MFKRLFSATLIALPLFCQAVVEETPTLDTPVLTQEQLNEQEQYLQQAQTLWDSLNRITGEIKLSNGVATLQVPESFYFLNSKDAEKVLVDVWGNPPNREVLGMLMPADVTPFDAESWAVTISYEQDGYVSDQDADKINYDELLTQMKSDTQAASEERVAQGYGAIELVGWASQPYYDAAANKLHWAKEIKFDQGPTNTLNYNIRMLGRKGVLVLNFIADMQQKQQIDDSLSTVLAIAEFDQGSRYSDFDPDIDDVAAYGIGALIAGKVIAKTGFLAMLIIFLKKFGIIIVIAIGAFAKSLFSSKKKQQDPDA